MSLVITTDNCMIGSLEPYMCLVCGKKFRKANTVTTCLWGTSGIKTTQRVSQPRMHRIRRTKEQWKEIISNHCSQCPHYIREPDERTLDGMVCALKLKGCSACTAWEKFYEFLLAGNGCPDKRFPPTETIREAATSRTWPTSKPAE